MLSVNYAECRKQSHYAECRYAECRYAECSYADCHYAECHYAECHTLFNVMLSIIRLVSLC